MVAVPRPTAAADHLEGLAPPRRRPRPPRTRGQGTYLFQQAETLKCYLIGNHKCFLSLSLHGLAAKFALDEPTIRRTACRLASEKLLPLSISRNGFLLFQQRRQSEGQKLCESLFQRLKEVSQTQENALNQKVHAGYDS